MHRIEGRQILNRTTMMIDGDLNNDSEYARLVSTLESHDKHTHMLSESTDVLEGVACASLSLDIMHEKCRFQLHIWNNHY